MPGPAAIGKIVRTREAAGTMTGATAGTTTTETACCLLSAALSGERLSEGVRSHRGIENRLHCRLDAVINEDQARSQSGHGPQNLAILWRMARNGTQKDTAKGSPRSKFKRAGWDDKYLASLIALFWDGVALLRTRLPLGIPTMAEHPLTQRVPQFLADRQNAASGLGKRLPIPGILRVVGASVHDDNRLRAVKVEIGPFITSASENRTPSSK